MSLQIDSVCDLYAPHEKRKQNEVTIDSWKNKILQVVSYVLQSKVNQRWLRSCKENLPEEDHDPAGGIVSFPGYSRCPHNLKGNLFVYYCYCILKFTSRNYVKSKALLFISFKSFPTEWWLWKLFSQFQTQVCNSFIKNNFKFNHFKTVTHL